MTTPTSVLLAGGGSAGHVSPLLALADALLRRHPGLRVTALGTESGLEARLVPAHGLDLRFVPKVPLPRRPSADLVRLPLRLQLLHRQLVQRSGLRALLGQEMRLLGLLLLLILLLLLLRCRG